MIDDRRNLDPKYNAFEYQKDAVNRLKNLEYGAIFHEQGLGKSKIALDLILHWLQFDKVEKVILVVKKTLVNNWKRELEHHTFLNCRIVGNDPVENRKAFITRCHIIIAHYESVPYELTRFKSLIRENRTAMILDESTKIKNPNAGISKVFHELSHELTKRFILTGTPVANRPYDVWSQIFFLDFGRSLGRDFKEFKKRYDLDNKMSDGALSDSQAAACSSLFICERQNEFTHALLDMKNKLASFCVRENKTSEHIDLPEKIIKNIACQWEQNQLAMYKTYKNELSSIVVRGNKIIDDSTNSILKKLLRFVQIASNPRLVDEQYRNKSGKEEKLDRLLKDIDMKDEKVIVWSTFIETAKFLSAKYKSLSPARVDGSMTIDRRQYNIDKFLNNHNCKALFATTGAAKEGLTLTVANHAIFYDRGFSLDDYLQAQDRIHRVSQINTCYVYNLVMEDSVDEWVESLLSAKSHAAQLAQGDIELSTFQEEEDFTYGEILRRVLDVE